MPSTYSALKIELIATGEQPGTWGNTTNVNLGSGGAGLEQAIVGMATLVTGDFTANSYTMPYNNTNGLQDFRALVLDITATLSAAGEVIVPAIEKPYIVMNNSVGGFAVTVKVSGQPGVSIPNGAKVLVYNNGTDVGPAITYLTSLTLGSPLAATSGGTGQSSYTTGDLLVASSSTALTKLAGAATGNALISGGVGAAPSYGKIGLTTHVSGTLPIGNGGTGLTTVPALSVPVANTLNTLTTVTGTAGQSIRVNAGGTAWEAYTPATSSGTVTSVSWTGGVVSIANPTTTPAFTIAGTSGGIPYFSSGTTWATSAALAANSLVVGGGAGVAPSTVTTGTGVLSALGTAVGSSGAFTTNNSANTFTAAQTFRAANAVRSEAASTQDAVVLAGRAGGTGSFAVTLTPTTLAANRTITLPDADINFTTGLSVAQGGTGTTSLTANNVLLGNGTSALQVVAPGTAGNVLTSDGTTWVSQAAGASLSGDTDSATPFETSLGYQAGNVNTGENNTFIGYQSGLANTTGTDNTAVGFKALDANTSGWGIVAIGSNALGANTTGRNSVAVGFNALLNNTSGNNNVALGFRAMNNNSVGRDNVAVGYDALYANTSGEANIGIGYAALTANTTGINNVAVGWNALLSNTTGTDNTAVGFKALDANTTGIKNTAFGSDALGANVDGNYNTAVGYEAGLSNTGSGLTAFGQGAARSTTVANGTTAIGMSALYANTTGAQNTAVGSASLRFNSSGGFNTAIGNDCLFSNTTGANNTAVGWSALYSNTTGISNAAVGYQALYTNTGSSNTAIGWNALYANTSVSGNTAVGAEALRFNTTGISLTAVGQGALRNNTTGTDNTAIGINALYSNTTGFLNTAVGVSALSTNTTGTGNSGFGFEALYANTTGVNNTAVGHQSGDKISTGTQNTMLGTSAGSSGTNDLTTGSNNTVIGYNAATSSATVSNTVTLGNSSIATLRCQVTTITGLSDRRDKKDIVDLGSVMSLVNELKPVSFKWNMRDGGKVDIPEIGFIAQDLQEAQAKSGIEVPNLVYDDNPDKLEASPSALIPVLVKAIQELCTEIEVLKAQINRS